MKNILTIDLEDWYQLARRRIKGQWSPPTDNIFRQLDTLLNLLADANQEATFFVMGMLAERHPNLIKQIDAQGHEIASHGYAHLTIDRLSRKQFEEDTKQAKGLLEDITGQPIHGYRAAEFSIRRKTLWALEVLAELGFEYDSSIFPIYHRRYGIAGFCPQVKRYGLQNGLQIIEIPLTTLPLGKLNLPIAGGGYFRTIPLWLICRAVNQLSANHNPMVIYLHPYEFDSQCLNVFKLLDRDRWNERLRGFFFNFHQNLGRDKISFKLAELLNRFRFTTCQEFLDETQLTESKKLL